MSDDQGDAEFEASPADIDAGNGDRAEDERGVAEIRRLFAGLHEDLLQLRAIARSIAERDLTEDVRAVRGAVEDLAARDVNAPVREELSGLRDLVVGIQASDPAGQVRSELDPLRDGLDRITARLADDTQHRLVLERVDGLERRLEQLAGADRSSEVLERLDTLSTSTQVRGLAADLRAHLADALGGLDGDALSAEMARVRETVDGQAGAVTDTLQRLQEALLDVASGEVVGALWDELRALRDSVDSYARAAEADGGGDVDTEAVVARLRDELDRLATGLQPDDAAAREAADGVARTSADVQALGSELNGAVSELRAVAAAVDRLAAGQDRAPADDGDDREDRAATRTLLDSLADDLAGLRTELHDGLVVEPSDDLTATLEALQAQIGELRSALASLPTMQVSLDTLRETIAGLDVGEDAPAADAGGSPADAAAAEIRRELEAVRSAVEAVQTQLDEGLVLADDVELPAVRGGEDFASIDPDTVDLLREEIRTAGSVSDQVVEALREELKALRRRLAVKAQEKVLSDDQLRTIADAVAERLGRD